MAVSCGSHHTLALAEEGQVLACGWGALGISQNISSSDCGAKATLGAFAASFLLSISSAWMEARVFVFGAGAATRTSL